MFSKEKIEKITTFYKKARTQRIINERNRVLRGNYKERTTSPFRIAFSIYFLIYLFITLVFSGKELSLFSLNELFFGIFINNILVIPVIGILLMYVCFIIYYIICYKILENIYFSFFSWVSDLFNRDDWFINRELNNLGYVDVRYNNILGFILFLISEVLVFGGLFWALFFNMCVPSYVIGSVWPPLLIPIVYAYKVPLLNTFFLIFSGITITLFHKVIRLYVSKY